MHILVTGAGGFIGRAVVRELTERGHTVAALVHRPESAPRAEALGARPIVGDILEPAAWLPALGDVRAVCHLAADLRRPPRAAAAEHERIQRVRVEGTRNVLELCAAAEMAAVVASGNGVYGDQGAAWLDESTAPNPDPSRAHILAADELALAARGEGEPVTILRLPAVYGAGSWFARLVSALQTDTFRWSGPGDHYWSVAQVREVARAFALAVERPAPSPLYLIAADDPPTYHEFVATVAERLGATLPEWDGQPAAEPVSSARVRNTLAQVELGWAPLWPTWREGVAATLADLAQPASGERAGG